MSRTATAFSTSSFQPLNQRCALFNVYECSPRLDAYLHAGECLENDRLPYRHSDRRPGSALRSGGLLAAGNILIEKIARVSSKLHLLA